MLNNSRIVEEINSEKTGIKKPNFFIVGAVKSATSSLHYYLKQHPEIYLSNLKEPHFFDREYTTSSMVLRVDTLEEYLALFKAAKNEPVIGEATVWYLFFEDIPYKIKEFQKDAKILISLRNPADRAFSAFRMFKYAQLIDKDFDYYIENGMNLEDVEIFASGLYYEQVKRYFNVFGKENVKVVFYEDIANNTETVLKDICLFLGVDDSYHFDITMKMNETKEVRFAFISKFLTSQNFITDALKKNVLIKKYHYILIYILKSLNGKEKKVSMTDSQRNRLKEYYREDIMKLSKLLNKNLDHWL